MRRQAWITSKNHPQQRGNGLGICERWHSRFLTDIAFPHRRTTEDHRGDRDEDEPPRNQLSLAVHPNGGRKVLHINPAEYTAHPKDIIAEPWISNRIIQYAVVNPTKNPSHPTVSQVHIQNNDA